MNINNNINRLKFRIKTSGGMIYVMEQYIYDEISEILYKLIENFSELNKDSLIKLLKRLNNLNDKIQQDYIGFHKKAEIKLKEQISSGKDINNEIIKRIYEESHGGVYVYGQTYMLIRIIVQLLQLIKEIQEKNTFTEEDNKVVEESKNKDDLSYLG